MTNNDSPCHARRQGDELVCTACRLRWDVADAERPECRKAPPILRTVPPERMPYASGLPEFIR